MLTVEDAVQSLTPVKWDITNDIVIYGSEMKMTNIRIFREIINISQIQKILAEYIVEESGKLILGDNANKQLYLPSYEYRAEEARNV